MTKEEKLRLKSLFEDCVNERAKRYLNPVLEDHSILDEDSSQFYTSVAELQVFHLPPEDLHRLHAAFNFYEIFIDIIHGHNIDEEIVDLIKKARTICPPIHYFGKEFEFRTGCDEQQWFTWFAKEFFDLSIRSSHAFWHKKSFNLSHLTKFKDEITPTRFAGKDIERIFQNAPTMGPELIKEFYEALEKGGVAAVNNLFASKGTFNPDFKKKQDVIEYIVLMKKVSKMPLTLEEEAIANLNRYKS
jgi:hypothetical protein